MLNEQTIANSQYPLNPKEPRNFIFASDALAYAAAHPDLESTQEVVESVFDSKEKVNYKPIRD